MKKSSKSPANRLKKIGTKFLENIVGGKGGNPRALSFDEEHAMADVHADEVLEFEDGDERLIAHEEALAAEEAVENNADSSDGGKGGVDILGDAVGKGGASESSNGSSEKGENPSNGTTSDAPDILGTSADAGSPSTDSPVDSTPTELGVAAAEPTPAVEASGASESAVADSPLDIAPEPGQPAEPAPAEPEVAAEPTPISDIPAVPESPIVDSPLDIAPEPGQPAEPDAPAEPTAPAEPSYVGESPTDPGISDPVAAEVNETTPSTTSEKSDDGLVHDGKITVTLGGDAYKGNPQYAIVVDGKEVSRGEVDWSKVTDGGQGTSNGEVVWHDVSVDYDFSEGMPKNVEVKFLQDAWGGHGSGEDRNLIVDKIQVDGLSIESEGDFTKYERANGTTIDGQEGMWWKGDLEFNVGDAYDSHLQDKEATSQSDSKETPEQTDVSADQPSEEKERRGGEVAKVATPEESPADQETEKSGTVDTPEKEEAKPEDSATPAQQAEEAPKEERENLLKNPSFNSEVDDAKIRNGHWSSITTPDGWELTKGSGVEIIDGELNKYGKGSNANDVDGNYIELDGINSSGIAQSIEANVGQTYDLAFDFGARDAHGGDNKMEVWWEGQLVDTIEKQADGGSNWSTYSYQVTAGDPSQLGDLTGKLEFRSVGDNDRGGELLDNVALMVAESEVVEKPVEEKERRAGETSAETTSEDPSGNTITGTSDDDDIRGTKEDDTIRGGAGDDDIRGGAGEDEIRGGKGDDDIRGGAGNDDIRGGAGDDDLRGGKGDDTIRGGAGDDDIRGGQGDDDLRGGKGDDTIRGGAGDDTIRGGQGDDDLRGGKGDDTIRGGAGDDDLRGGAGDDVLKGGAGDDRLLG
ncbi:hypothetical protein N9A58_05135, partial [Opitutales bacterium]|nr:hypothetical protein [Opitutales bacterium]